MEDRRCTYARSKAGLRNCSSLFRSLCLWCNNTCSKHSSKPDHVSKHQSHPPSRQINRSPIHNGSKSTGWKIQRILSRFAKKGAYNQQATNVATHNLSQNILLIWVLFTDLHVLILITKMFCREKAMPHGKM